MPELREHGPDGVRREWEALDNSGWVLTRHEIRAAMAGCAECAAVTAHDERLSRMRAAYRRRAR